MQDNKQGKDRKLQNFKSKNKSKQDKVNANVQGWAEFSLSPRTEDEIREQIEKDKKVDRGLELCCFTYICTHSKLTEEFIEELIELTKVDSDNCKGFTDKLDWVAICTNQKLSEEFIEKHADQVDWKSVLKNQDLSKDFILKHKDRFQVTDLEAKLGVKVLIED